MLHIKHCVSKTYLSIRRAIILMGTYMSSAVHTYSMIGKSHVGALYSSGVPSSLCVNLLHYRTVNVWTMLSLVPK